MAKVRKLRIPPKISDEAAQRLIAIADKAAGEFNGNFEELESAIGMLFLGRLMGWKPLLVIHNKRTIKKYEQILGVDFRKEFDDVGPYADRSLAWDLVEGLSNFWKAVNGDTPVPNRRLIGKP